MSSQREQAAVQAASDTYVDAHQWALLTETNVTHQYGLGLYLYSFHW